MQGKNTLSKLNKAKRKLKGKNIKTISPKKNEEAKWAYRRKTCNV